MTEARTSTPYVRAAREDELPALAALEREVFGEGAYPAFVLRQAFDALDLAVAVTDDVLVGYVLFSLAAGAADAWIWSLAVAPAHRGRGHADALLAHAESTVAARGARGVRLHVAPTNERAGRLYERRGYVEVDFLPEAFGPGGDRRVLRRVLG